jgi:hypothetical protein
MAKDAKKAARADVRSAQTKFDRIENQREEARKARRESFERARKAGLTLREIGEAADLHWSRVAEVIKK